MPVAGAGEVLLAWPADAVRPAGDAAIRLAPDGVVVLADA